MRILFCVLVTEDKLNKAPQVNLDTFENKSCRVFINYNNMIYCIYKKKNKKKASYKQSAASDYMILQNQVVQSVSFVNVSKAESMSTCIFSST